MIAVAKNDDRYQSNDIGPTPMTKARRGGVRRRHTPASADIDIPSVEDWGIDFIVSSANKCIRGAQLLLPPSAVATCWKAAAAGAACRSTCTPQWRTMERDDGRWRFTSPTNAVAARLRPGLRELEERA